MDQEAIDNIETLAEHIGYAGNATLSNDLREMLYAVTEANEYERIIDTLRKAVAWELLLWAKTMPDHAAAIEQCARHVAADERPTASASPSKAP